MYKLSDKPPTPPTLDGFDRTRTLNIFAAPTDPSKSGQVLVETVIVAASMLALVAIISLLIYAFKEHGGRVLDLLASDYP